MSFRVSETHPRNNREFTPMDLRQSRRDFGMQTIASSLAAGLTLGSIAARGFPLGSLAIGDEPPNPNSLGKGQIQGDVHGRRLIITTTSRVAGAVDSMRYQGVEFIDSHDHGRQMQSAASFDCSRDDPFWPERFNPTEAGSRSDGLGPSSTSRLLSFEAKDKTIQTKNQMAFWLPPGEQSFGRPGLNTTRISNHLLEKRIQIGCSVSPNAIQVDVAFEMPRDEKHRLAQFEVLTGYMPVHFQRFWRWDAGNRSFDSLDDARSARSRKSPKRSEN